MYKSDDQRQVILRGFDATFQKGERVGIVEKWRWQIHLIQIMQGLEKADNGKSMSAIPFNIWQLFAAAGLW